MSTHRVPIYLDQQVVQDLADGRHLGDHEDRIRAAAATGLASTSQGEGQPRAWFAVYAPDNGHDGCDWVVMDGDPFGGEPVAWCPRGEAARWIAGHAPALPPPATVTR